MKSRHSYLAVLLATTALVAVNPRSAQAQTAPQTSEEGDANEDAIEEMIVRATRYLPEDRTSGTGLEMSLIETPAAISVVTDEMLRVFNARTAYDAADLVPGIEKGGQAASREILIQRGTAVTMTVNGMGVRHLSYPDAFALDRIEFVRGPSTGIYSISGSFAGEVNSVLKEPQVDLRTEFGVQFGDFDRSRYEFDVTGAIPGTDERLSARAVGAYTEYGTPVVGVHQTNRDKMGLISLAYEFPSDWQATFAYYRQDRSLDPADGCTMVQRPDGTLVLPDFVDAEHFYCSAPETNWQEQTQQLYYGSVEHQFNNEWHIKAAASLGKTHDDYSYFYPFGPAGAYGLADNDVYLYTYDPENFQEELVFNMSLGGDFDLFSRKHRFFIGAEYLERPKSGNTNRILQSVGVGFFDIRQGGLGILSDGSPIPFIDRSTLPVSRASWSNLESWSGTAQVLLDPIDRLQLLVGVQYGGSKTRSQLTVPLRDQQEDRQDPRWTGRVGATYQLTDGWGAMNDARLYATYYQKTTPNAGLFDVNGQELTDPVERTSMEVGLKMDFLDSALTGTIALYDQKVTNIPALRYDLGGLADLRYELKGENVVQGLEVDIVGQVAPGWNVALSYGYTDAVIHDNSPNPDVGLLEIPIRSVPKNRASLLSTYEFLEGPLRGVSIGGAVIYKQDYSLVDTSATMVDRFGQFVGSGYTRVDLHVGYLRFTGALSGLELFAKVENVTDVDYFYSRNGDPRFTIIHAPPRNLTVGFQYVHERQK